MAHGRITDEALDHLSRRIGVPIATRPQPHVEEVSVDTIRHFAWGMGDENPLWTDRAHAEAGPHGRLTGPPAMLYATDRIVSGYVGGLPGVHALFAGTDFRWTRALLSGDRIEASPALLSLEEKQSRFAKRAIKQTYRVGFATAEGEAIAEVDSWCFRTERDTARGEGKYSEVPLRHAWTPDEIEAVAASYRDYRRRGAEPRLASSVKVGDRLPTLPKGPLTVTGIIAWDQGWGGLYIRAHKLAFDMFEAHPALGIPNEIGVPDVPERVHWEDDFAREIGAPGAYDYGPERVAWLSQAMTDWIGDHGFLERLYAEVRRFNVIGDLTRIDGTVSEVGLDGDPARVKVDLKAVNQRGETTAFGWAIARLPTK